MNQRISRRSAAARQGIPPVDPLAAEPLPPDDDPVLPADLRFTPVPRKKPRSNGLTPMRQRQFIRALALLGSVKGACRVIGCSDFAIYALRDAPGAEEFAAAWARAVERGARRVIDVMLDHAINGVPETIIQDGHVVAERRAFNLRGQMFIAQKLLPQRPPPGASGARRSDVCRACGQAHDYRSHPLRPYDAPDNWLPPDVLAAQIAKAEAAAINFSRSIEVIRTGFKRWCADAADRRAAWTLLTEDADWDDFGPIEDDAAMRATINLNRADIIVPFAARPVPGSGGSDGSMA